MLHSLAADCGGPLVSVITERQAMIDRREILKLASAVAVTSMFSVAPGRAAAGGSDTGANPNKLLFVHGRGQQGLDPTALKADWLATLERGAGAAGLTLPGNLDVAFPYYGNRLDAFTRQSEIPLTVDIQARGAQQDDEFLQFQAEVAEAVRQRAGITDAQVDAEYGDNPRQRGPLNWQWVQAILRAIDKHGGGMSQETLELFTRDVFLYTSRAGVRDEIDQIVGSMLTEQPTVVVAHSLGTVVAYNILRTDRRALRVPLFVTVGSPLAIRAIRDRLVPLRWPSPTVAWYNAFDTRDVVALYPLDADNFPVRPAIDNFGKVKNTTDNHHGIAGYLDDPQVATKILSTLGKAPG
ncbi:hypothetical protein ACPUER_34285 [Burkholderia sp. DN3021]|uniref:hypothetical protein n=1 Tax=Burkholderia sp. DN3021 TaxID=3410137 RepID=UPI003C7D8E3A